MNKIFLVLIAFCCLVVSGYSQATLTIGEVSGTPVNSVALIVQATNITDMIGFQFSITYDTTILTYVSCSNWGGGTNSSGVQINSAIAGILTFVYNELSFPVAISGGKFFDLNFTVNSGASGLSSINWSDTPTAKELSNSIPDVINCTFNNGKITVISCPEAPTISLTQPTCIVPSGTITVTAPNETGMTYSIDGLNYTSTTGIFTLLGPGNYTVTAKNASGCVSTGTNVTIDAVPSSPSAPSIGTITQPTCSVATGSVVLSGLPSPEPWILTRQPGGTTYTGTGTSYTLADLLAGTYTFTVTNSFDCVSTASANVVINQQPTCQTADLAVSNFLFSPQTIDVGVNPSAVSFRLANIGSANLVSPNTHVDGVFYISKNTTFGDNDDIQIGINGYDFTLPSGYYMDVTLSSMGRSYISVPSSTAGGDYYVFVQVKHMPPSVLTDPNPGNDYTMRVGMITVISPCVSPAAPIIGTITQPSCSVATGSVVLNGLPATGTWTLTKSPGGTTSTGTGTSSTISGLEVGTYTYTVTNASGCVSTASANVVINAQLATPTAPTVGTITQPTCSVTTGSVVLNGLPATGTWTLTKSPGGTTSTGTGTSSTISGLEAGTYTYTVTNASDCVSTASANVVINAQLATPTAPTVGTITQPTCTLATGSVVLSGLPAGSWTINPGAITGSTGSTTISNLAAGTYTYTVTNASGCTSTASANVVINAQLATPTAPTVGTITQPTCALATGSVVLNGLPSTGTWTLTKSPGGIINTGTGTSSTISGLEAGTYTYTVTNASDCVSKASANVVINAQLATQTAPIVGTITQPTYALATGSVVLNGLPATGTWTLTKSPGGTTNTGTGTSSTISGLEAGTYTYTVTNTSGCISGQSTDVIINEYTTDIEPLKESLNFHVYPNPTNGEIEIVTNSKSFIGTYISVYDLTGKTIAKHLVQNAEEWLDLSGNTPGVYLIKSDFKEIKPFRIVLK